MVPLKTLREAADRDEAAAVRDLLSAMDSAQRAAALQLGRGLVRGVRARASERSYLDAFLQEFGLSNEEGVALMCLAEALLRIPDDATADLLIAEKLASGDWSAHQGQSDSLFVNASTWGLMLTGQFIELPTATRKDTGGWLRGLSRRIGEPILRQALRGGMRLIGSEFVVGRDIEEALARGRRDAALGLCSFDMLGEGARTDSDALRHLESYRRAIHAIGNANRKLRRSDLHAASSISIKLSALDPRYALTQREHVRQRLIPRVLELARIAASEGLGLTVDAEEADRLEISLEVIEALARDTETLSWSGLGLAVQAYGRRAPVVIDWISALARQSNRQMTVRLVKGAYWDSEVKRAQERGLDGYPVYTRKVSTDVAYLACARQLFDAGSVIYPQFATHNAHTIGAVLAMQPDGARFEFQRLHGMGKLLYEEAQRTVQNFPQVRVYAPVGQHAELLAYLVRRLLENGANTSFVNRCLDESLSVEEVVNDPLEQLEALGSIPHPDIPLPSDLFGAARRNSRGVDFGQSHNVEALESSVATARGQIFVSTLTDLPKSPRIKVTNPANHQDVVGEINFESFDGVARAFDLAGRAHTDWNATPVDERATCLERAADALESQRNRFVSLLVREAGKTLTDAISEIREAVDFCRYYAVEARRLFNTGQELPGPTGESNRLLLQGRGVVACISPWNFPLAIFTGQIAAALVAGNTVVAKPAESTPLVGSAMTELLHQAGVPQEVLRFVAIKGRVFGEVALQHPALSGIVFTGSTATGQWLNRALAARSGAILPLIAETGGLNAMIADSTALPEQLVDDVVTSAFSSAGQRCSALRLLLVQEDVADRTIDMLQGAMDELEVGDPAHPSTDIGPVISQAAAASLNAYVERMHREARVLKACKLNERHNNGSFVAPHLIELHSPSQLAEEQFGPLLHVCRYRARDLDAVLEAIRSSGYGLTLGVQTRLESTWSRVFRGTSAGNTYINRNMIGAVVGVQPFGGSGLSGTGPKAGGPHYLPRLAIERTLTINTAAQGGNTALLRLS